MSWLTPIFALGSKLIGGMLGNSSSSSSSRSESEQETINSARNILSEITSQMEQTQDTTQETTGTTTQQSTQQTDQQTEQQQQAQQESQQAQTTSRLDEATLGQLTSEVQNMLSGVSQNNTAIRDEISDISNASDFDVDSFVNGIMQQAGSRAAANLESGMNQVQSRSGASAGRNSAAALLTNRLQNDTISNLAGVEQKARATGEEILTNQIQTTTQGLTNLSSAASQQTQGLLQALLGAREQQTATGTTTETQQSTGSQTGTTTGTTTTESQETQQATTETQQSQTQNQKQSETQTQDRDRQASSKGSSKTRERDWTEVFGNIAEAFGASF